MVDELIELLTEQLMEQYPDAKVEYKGGYWDVTMDAGIGTIVESYRHKNGKLIHFATIETED